MSKIGVNLKIDITKVDKTKFFIGKNGAKYLDMTAFIDIDEQDQYGNNGMIVQSVSKEDKDNKIQGAILGNSKLFWSSAPQAQAPQSPQAPPVMEDFEDDPFG
tara:strand:- start:811 stop:1119 length:309 start_codon:yes stop_codon:yes gene_type:complete